MQKRMYKIVLALVLYVIFVFPVSAARQGSLLLKDVQQPAALCMVADAQGTLCGPFTEVAKALTQNDLTPATAKALYQCAQDKNVSCTVRSDDTKNEIRFSSLEEGWYLVYSVGEEAEFAPFLVAVPMRINGQSLYDVQAEPKVDSPVTPPSPSTPVTPKPNIPQTGAIQWPKYLLLILGGVAIVVGIIEVMRGREEQV